MLQRVGLPRAPQRAGARSRPVAFLSLYDDYTEAMKEAVRDLAVGFGIKVFWMFHRGSWRALGARGRCLWPRSR